MVIFYVDMRLQMIQNLYKRKYYFYASVLIFRHYSCHKSLGMNDYNENKNGTLF
jgi:hypothetical protein